MTGSSQGAGLGFELRSQDPIAAAELGRGCGVSAATAQVLLHRGIADAGAATTFLNPRLAELTPPDGMADWDAAVGRIADGIRRREQIVVFGDYDVDGMTSATIVADTIAHFGGRVERLVANRFDGGYGFSAPALARCMAHRPSLIVTCDCGSADHERLEEARRTDIDVVVIDHHLVPEQALPATAFLNPHRPDCAFPTKGLCSAGLAFFVAAGLRRALQRPFDVRRLLDLVALGTIADVAPLTDDNRRLVRAGMLRLGSDQARPGVIALRESAGLPPRSLGAMEIAFRLAPRLNAAGRLGDASVALRLLGATNVADARELAAELEAINLERRAQDQRCTEEAVRQVEEIYGKEPAGGIVVASPAWHRGVVGITAARLVDRFGVSVAVVAFDDDGVGHGSARTTDDGDVHGALSAAKTELIGFGGHARAAGLTVHQGNLDRLRAAFADAAPRTTKSRRGPKVDVRIDGGAYQIPPVAELEALEPTGEGNREPVFLLADAGVESADRVGQGRHLKLRLRVGGRVISGFGFELGDLAPTLGPRADLLGGLRPDHYRGGDAIELRVVAAASA